MTAARRHRRYRLVAGLAVGLMALAGCGAATEADVAATEDAPSVTQEAPSVWATAPTDVPAATSADGDLTSEQTSLPGLSEECSDAIRAQSAVNELIGRALREAARQIGEQDDDPPSDEFTPVLSDAEITETFDRIDGLVPAALTADFAALRDAAEQVTKTAPTDIPGVMEETAVTGAITAISDFIADCQPIVDEDE